jgi:DNA modification methylase
LRDKEFGLDKHNATKSRKALFSGTDLSIKNIHPTVKPIALMRHLVRLLSKPGDIVLDCFLGSGSTGISAILEGRKFIGMEINKDYFDVATARIERTQNLIKKFKVTDPEQLMVLAELDSLNEKLDEIAKLVLKNPGNRVHQEKLEKLSKLKELRCKDLLKIKKAA